jgi:hypothetical protein
MELQVHSSFNYKPRPVSIRVPLGISLLLLTLSAVFGFLNTSKIKALRAESANAIAARTMAENARIAQRKQPRGNVTNSGATSTQMVDAQARLEAEAAKAQSEKAAALAKLQATENQLAQLQRKMPEVSPSTAESAGPSVAELQAQLDEARRQLDHAEREKLLVAEKTHGAEPLPAKAPEEKVKRRRVTTEPGLHGTILAVNQAYNFVVLNLGGRQGVEPNAEMLVLRGGTLIGKIRVSSVEPATAIGDIISSSLPRGVQVQPGDTVVYVGPGS